MDNANLPELKPSYCKTLRKKDSAGQDCSTGAAASFSRRAVWNRLEWRHFFSLTGGSILYCLSALSILYGVIQILGPAMLKPGFFVESLWCILALNVYEFALLGVLVLIVVWKQLCMGIMQGPPQQLQQV